MSSFDPGGDCSTGFHHGSLESGERHHIFSFLHLNIEVKLDSRLCFKAVTMKPLSAPLLALLAAIPVFADNLANSLTIIIVTEWTDGVIDKVPIRILPPDVRLVNGLSLQRVGDLHFDHVGQIYEFNTAQTGWGGHEYYRVSCVSICSQYLSEFADS
jgi:hypothetical protein